MEDPPIDTQTGQIAQNPFSAVDAALGYLYQVRSALLWSLQRQRSEPDFLVSVETLDDVSFETVGGDATDLLQTKHHLARTASLTDASPDLWKTLRIWFVGHTSGSIPPNANLHLITTGTAPDGSAASRLRADPRDVAAAQQALDATAASSTNQANDSAYKVYLAATQKVCRSVLERIVIIDAASTIDDLDGEIRQEVYWAVDKEHHAPFVERLEGWWLRRVIHQLLSTDHNRIGSVELEAQMSDLREQFKHESLPIDDDIIDFILDDATRVAHEDSTFVRQMAIIKAGKSRIAAAIRDYYRAFEQRSRWLRDDLIAGLDLHKYENLLIEEWELVFAAMLDDIGQAATDDAKEQAARTVLAWAERNVIPIRANVTAPFVSRGSLHMLSDQARIGWHPEFRDLLASLLGAKEGYA
jgi:hypothetical protein